MASAAQIAFMSSLSDAQLTYPVVLPDGSLDWQGDLGVGEAGHEGLALTPDGKRLFVAALDGNVYPLRVPASGYPVIAAGGPEPVGVYPISVVSATDGRSIYVTSDDSVVSFSVTRDGSVEPKAGPPATVPGELRGLAATPNGRYLYAAGTVGFAPDGRIFGWSIRPGGTLRALPGTPYPAPEGPYAISIAPNGKYLYVPGRFDGGRIGGYRIAGDGTLTELPGAPFVAAGSANTLSSAITPDGQNLYTMDNSSGEGAAFSIRRSGKLVPLAGPAASFTTSGNPSALTASADGKRIYVRSSGVETVDGFRRRASGRLTPLPGSPFEGQGLGEFQSIALSPAQPPRARLSAKKRARVGTTVRFDASRSGDDGEIARYRWKFGDGEARTSTAPRVRHRFRKPGRYRVRVIVTDDDGCSAKFLSAGQTAYCNGSKRAIAKARIRVKRKRR